MSGPVPWNGMRPVDATYPLNEAMPAALMHGGWTTIRSGGICCRGGQRELEVLGHCARAHAHARARARAHARA